MTETNIPTRNDRRRGRTGVAALSLTAGAMLGIAGTVLATADAGAPTRPTVVQRLAADQPSSHDDGSESACQLLPADAAERCVEDRAARVCHSLSADAAERCVADRAGSG
jgi:hypothetical protein